MPHRLLCLTILASMILTLSCQQDDVERAVFQVSPLRGPYGTIVTVEGMNINSSKVRVLAEMGNADKYPDQVVLESWTEAEDLKFKIPAECYLCELEIYNKDELLWNGQFEYERTVEGVQYRGEIDLSSLEIFYSDWYFTDNTIFRLVNKGLVHGGYNQVLEIISLSQLTNYKNLVIEEYIIEMRQIDEEINIPGPFVISSWLFSEDNILYVFIQDANASNYLASVSLAQMGLNKRLSVDLLRTVNIIDPMFELLTNDVKIQINDSTILSLNSNENGSYDWINWSFDSLVLTENFRHQTSLILGHTFGRVDVYEGKLIVPVNDSGGTAFIDVFDLATFQQSRIYTAEYEEEVTLDLVSTSSVDKSFLFYEKIESNIDYQLTLSEYNFEDGSVTRIIDSKDQSICECKEQSFEDSGIDICSDPNVSIHYNGGPAVKTENGYLITSSFNEDCTKGDNALYYRGLVY